MAGAAPEADTAATGYSSAEDESTHAQLESTIARDECSDPMQIAPPEPTDRQQHAPGEGAARCTPPRGGPAESGAAHSNNAPTASGRGSGDTAAAQPPAPDNEPHTSSDGCTGIQYAASSTFKAFIAQGQSVAHVNAEEMRKLLSRTEELLLSWKGRAIVMALLALFLGLALVREEQYRIGLTAMVDRFTALELDATFRRTYAHWVMENTEFRPGRRAAQQGLGAVYNVLLVPGFVTSGMELWQGPPCADKYFRHRIWGHLGMMSAMFRNISCWLEVMHLDPTTGMDPPGIKVRPMQGLDAIDYWMPGYVVWAGVIRALADLGHDPDDMACAPYDWRLSLHLMQQRDSWFSRFKASVEMARQYNGRKALLMGHSWGSTVVLNFMHWAEQQEPGWVEENVGVFLNIGGPLLGVPKAVSSLLSGETRDTVDLGATVQLLTENFVGRRQRAALFRTWGSAVQMLPQGGTAVWGNATWAPDDTPQMRSAGKSYGSFLTAWALSGVDAAAASEANLTLPAWVLARLRGEGGTAEHNEPGGGSGEPVLEELDVEGAVSAVMADAGSVFAGRAAQWLALATAAQAVRKVVQGDKAVRLQDLLHTPLPPAPSLRIYCFYGVGKPADRAYHYLYVREGNKEAGDAAGGDGGSRDGDRNGSTSAGRGGDRVHWRINTEVQEAELGLDTGVWTAEGDGTVPLLSLGGMCRQPWAPGSPLNPAGLRVVTREYQHSEAASGLLQGGPGSADHVDILANHDFLEDVVQLAAGRPEAVPDRILSNIDEIAGAMWGEVQRRASAEAGSV